MPAIQLTKGAGSLRRTSFTKTYANTAGNGAIGAVTLFTVTGEVLIAYLTAFCTTSLTGATATITLGVTGKATVAQTPLFIAATTATGITSGLFWVDTAPDANGIAVPAALKDIVITDNILNDVAVADLTGGVIRYDCYWLPLSSDGLVA